MWRLHETNVSKYDMYRYIENRCYIVICRYHKIECTAHSMSSWRQSACVLSAYVIRSAQIACQSVCKVLGSGRLTCRGRCWSPAKITYFVFSFLLQQTIYQLHDRYITDMPYNVRYITDMSYSVRYITLHTPHIMYDKAAANTQSTFSSGNTTQNIHQAHISSRKSESQAIEVKILNTCYSSN